MTKPRYSILDLIIIFAIYGVLNGIWPLAFGCGPRIDWQLIEHERRIAIEDLSGPIERNEHETIENDAPRG